MKKIEKKPLKNTKFIDLFAGIGGFRIALESLGSKCVYSSEWDGAARETYEINFKEKPSGDITKVNAKDIPKHDILCAGFPCQAFSISGNRKGFDDSRGTLFFDVARIVKERRPQIVFLENVKNFSTHDGGKTLAVVRDTLKELGYTFFYKVLNAADYGVPQKRERTYMVAFRENLKVYQFNFPQPFTLDNFVEDHLIKDPSLLETTHIKPRDDFQYMKEPPKKNQNKTIRVGIVGKGGQGERIYSIKGVAPTFSAYGGGVFAKTGGFLIGETARKLHPKECLSLMGFPKEFEIHSSQNKAYQQIGNSVVIDVLQLIALAFSKHITHYSITG